MGRKDNALSFQDTYNLLSEGQVPLSSYLTYSQLRQMGYIVRRHTEDEEVHGLSNIPLPSIPGMYIYMVVYLHISTLHTSTSLYPMYIILYYASGNLVFPNESTTASVEKLLASAPVLHIAYDVYKPSQVGDFK